MDINSITITGRIGTIKELATAKSGNEYIHFTVACNRMKRKDEEKAVTDWFNVTAFGSTAVYISTYLKVGSGVSVHGRIQSNKKDDKTYWELIADTVISFKGKDEKSEPNDAPVNGFAPLDDNDVPF